jgi:AraC-like DNA-binding protein
MVGETGTLSGELAWPQTCERVAKALDLMGELIKMSEEQQHQQLHRIAAKYEEFKQRKALIPGSMERLARVALHSAWLPHMVTNVEEADLRWFLLPTGIPSHTDAEAADAVSDKPREGTAFDSTEEKRAKIRVACQQRWPEPVCDSSEITVNYVSYGTGFHVQPTVLNSCYAVIVVLSGSCRFRAGSEDIEGLSGRAVVCAPAMPLEMRFEPGVRLVVVRIGKVAIESALSTILRGPLTWPIAFESRMDVRTGKGLDWLKQLAALVSCSARPLHDGLLLTLIKDAELRLITGLLKAQPHNYTPVLENEVSQLCYHRVRTAVGVLEENPRADYLVDHLVRSVGLSASALTRAFRRCLSTTPGAYLRAVRLRRVFYELWQGWPDSVAVHEVARHWGFRNPRTFERWYVERFGETPAETLQR